MSSRVLIVDGNSLTAENLRGRLASLGEVKLVTTAEALEASLKEDWSAIVTDWAIEGLEGAALLQRLPSAKVPTFLYTARTEVVEGGAWNGLGPARAFSHLQRADLVVAVEAALRERETPAAGLAPAFLLVEDSPTVRQFVKTVLGQAFPGAETLEADDGRKALAAMKTARVSLIITDLQMPGMDGLSFVQLLRNNAVLKKKPVLVLSGAVNDEARASLSALDRVQVLHKPATPQQLVDAVNQLLR